MVALVRPGVRRGAVCHFPFDRSPLDGVFFAASGCVLHFEPRFKECKLFLLFFILPHFPLQFGLFLITLFTL